jgi:hypothetical protein
MLEQWQDYMATEYLKVTTTLSAKDLRDEHVMLAALVLSYQPESQPLEFNFNFEDTTVFFGKTGAPINLIGIKVCEGDITAVVKGQETDRIRKKWSKIFADRLGCGFSEVFMEWV